MSKTTKPTTNKPTTNKPAPINTTQINCVINGLYISDYKIAKDKKLLKKLGIKRIISVGAELECPHKKEFEYMFIPIYDSPNENIMHYFDESNQFIKKNTLIHCQMGISRSATICLAYLMYKFNLSLPAAYEYLASKRNFIRPNDGFLYQLKLYEKKIRGV